MGHAVQLYFNPELEAALVGVRASLTQAGVTPTLERLGDRPHVSLAVLNAVDVARCIPMLERFSKTKPAFAVALAAFGGFPTAQGVVFLSPTPSEILLSTHRAMHRQLTDIGAQVHDYYVPDNWMPHATVGFELPGREMAVALSWLHAHFKPVAGMFSSIGLIEFVPVRELATFDLRRENSAR